MATDLTAAQFMKRLEELRSEDEKRKFHRYFTFDDNESGDGDQFIGVRMGHVFDLAKEFIQMTPSEIEKLLESPIHEARAGGCSIMGKQAYSKKTPESRRKELYDLYLRRHDRINDWDLVDLAAHKVVGSYLCEFNKPRDVLYQLARSKDTWERRSSIVATFFFIARGDVADAFAIAEILIDDDEDLVNKATGWALRAVGTKDKKALQAFLGHHAATMPRITLRNAIEHFSKEERDHYLGLKKSASLGA